MLQAKIDKDVPVPERSHIETTRFPCVEALRAASNTLYFLESHGVRLIYDKQAKDTATKIVLTYAEHPLAMETMTNRDLESHSAASVALAGHLLEEFGQSLVTSALQVRHLVTNKLIVESDNPDPKVRLKALELLGKISDVGLFAEKSEVTITHRSDTDLRKNLRDKLERLRKFEQETASAEDAVLMAEDVEELGLPDPEQLPLAPVVSLPRIEPKPVPAPEQGQGQEREREPVPITYDDNPDDCG